MTDPANPSRAGFNLSRHFAFSSLALIAIVGLALFFFYRNMSAGLLISMAEDRNEALTQIVNNSLRAEILPLLDKERTASRTAPEVGMLSRQIAALLSGTDAIKVKIYNQSGMTVFSSEPKQIGESKHNNRGFLTASKGSAVSELTYRDRFSAFEGEIQSRDVLATYIPIRPPNGGAVEGVAEVYSDVTPFLAGIKRTQWLIGVVTTLSLAVLYVLLYVVIRRAKTTIQSQQNQLARSLAEVEDTNRRLDARVEERTSELQRANRRMEEEIADRVRAENALRLTAKVFENTVEGVVITDHAGRILRVNASFCRVTGYSEDEVRLKTPAILKSGRHGEDFYKDMWAELSRSGQWVGEIWNRRKNGEVYPERLTIGAVRDADSQIRHFVGVFSDISDIKASEEKLNHLAHHDALTALPNRLLFNHSLEQSIQRARRKGEALALLFLDLDHFKNINDTLGHEIGDELIKAVAAILSDNLRKSDLLARLGGDEFVLLLNDVDTPLYAGLVAEKVLGLLTRTLDVGGHALNISASIGVSFFPADGDDVTTLVKNADTAMYHAKTHGRNSYHFYSADMSRYARERVLLEAHLRKSIERKELALVYQPKLDLCTGRLQGVEALVRWNSAALGAVPPDRFIPVAEDTGLILEIGAWVLREACLQMVQWDAEGFDVPAVAVNLSVRQLERDDIVESVSQVIAECALPPDRLELEVTESSIMNNDQALRNLGALHAAGISLSIDDFGTGYSSLSYLLRMPVQKIKIDRSFITRVHEETERMAIVRAIIAMAKSMGLLVIAEGVETAAETRFLLDEACDQGQGYFFSRPVSAPELQAQCEAGIARWRNAVQATNPDGAEAALVGT